jgi:HAD superfamily hydrolase (TIGR01484 family)
MKMVHDDDKLEYGLYTNQLLRMGSPPEDRWHVLLRDGYKEITSYESHHEQLKQQVSDGQVLVNKILVMGQQVDLERFSEDVLKDSTLSAHCPPIAELGTKECNFTVTQAVKFIKELTPATTSKGTGVKALMKHYSLEPDQVLVFGDGDNDIDMLSIPGVWSYCMANGMPGAKKVAKTIWPHGNSEDALAECLESIFLFGSGAVPSS